LKTWFVTGATRGLGLETARAALAAGDNVVATGRDLSRLGEGLPASDRLLGLALDVTDDASINAGVSAAVRRFGRIDVLVNNAGYGQLGAFEETSPEAIEQQFDTNVFGVFRVTRAVLPFMRIQRSGHIITISSMAGLVGLDGGSVYCASKFAIAGWSEAMSAELKRFGIFATSIHPGYSMRLADLSLDDYRESTATATQRRQAYNHNQAGDPVAFGRVMLELAAMAEPPVFFAAGSDAAAVMSRKSATLRDNAEQWATLSASTDFPPQA
jgi:NAD(P)-dependent dehydrogenase (short-subunit alcohol dehydrogenase family)